MKLEKIINRATGFKEADEYDIFQQIKMTSEQRQNAAKKLKERFYGSEVKDVREYYKNGR